MKKFIAEKLKGMSLRRRAALAAFAMIFITVFLAARSNGTPATQIAKVERGDVIAEISVSGKVVPAQNLELSFERGGRVEEISVSVGDTVPAGAMLARLENGQEEAQLLQARGALATQNTKLAQLVKGARPETIALSEAKKSSADKAYQNERVNFASGILDAFAKADDAVRNRADALFTNSRTSPKLIFFGLDGQTQIGIEADRFALEQTLVTWQSSLSDLNSSSDLAAYGSLANAKLLSVRAFLDKLFLAVSGLAPNSSASSANIDAWKTSLSTARSQVVGSTIAIGLAQTKLDAARAAADVAEREFALLTAPATTEEIALQESAVTQAAASVRNYESQWKKTVLWAPFDGVITKIVPVAGAVTAAQNPVIGIRGSGALEIEAYVAESDAAKILPGQTARVTLDAYGPDKPLTATVLYRDLSSTVIDGVVAYKTVLSLSGSEEANTIPSGLTADITVLRDKRENVLFVPTRAIVQKNGKRVVRIPQNGSRAPEERELTVGLRGSDGRTEILSGLTEGETIIVSERK